MKNFKSYASFIWVLTAIKETPGHAVKFLSTKVSRELNADESNQEMNVIVALDDTYLPPGLAKKAAIAALQDKVLENFQGKLLARYKNLNGFSSKLNGGQINALAAKKEVLSIDPMPIHEMTDAESHPLTDVDDAQAAGYDGTGTVIAIIDSGIDVKHAAFGGNPGSTFPTSKIIAGYDFGDYDPDPTYTCPQQSHGTAVAGVAAGDGGGVVGVAPKAQIVFLKIQSTSYCASNSLDGDILAAMDWIVDYKQGGNRVDVVNMSFGGGGYSSESACDESSTLYFDAVQAIRSEGIDMFASSGNYGWCDRLSRPACLSDVISVGATYDANVGFKGWCISASSCIGFSSSGCSTGRVVYESSSPDKVTGYSNSASFLDLVGPSTCANTAQAGGGTNTCFGGTSSSSPFSAGVAALVRQAAGSSSVDMRQVLRDTGDLVTDSKNGIATPRVNAMSAVSSVSGPCGNGAIDSGEDCDGTNLNGATCFSQGFVDGTLSCSSACSFDTSGCTMCGNDAIDAGEDCDGADLNTETCVTQGFDGGTLACTDTCNFDLSGCFDYCGDGIINNGEDCDGSVLGGATCATQGFGSGSLACSSECTFDTSGCSSCGNESINAGEDCDGDDLNGQSCISLGFESGPLACSEDCTFDTSGCVSPPPPCSSYNGKKDCQAAGCTFSKGKCSARRVLRFRDGNVY